MAYIGKQPTVGNFVKLDAITTSATTTFNLTNGGVAYSPQSPNHCIVSLNGVIQSPTSAYTISGSTIVFSDALTSSDTIDFILVLGDVLNIGTPSDSTVTAAKIVDGTIGLGKLSATGTKDSTTFLRGDNTFASAGITPLYFSAKGTGTYTLAHNTLTKVQYGTELFDSNSCYDNATNYRFTPTTAGYYHLGASILCYKSTNDLTYTQIGIYKNGTGGTKICEAGLQRYDNSSAFIYAMQPFTSGFGYANGTTDYFEVFAQAQQVGSGSISVDAGNTFSFGYRVA